MTGLLRRLTPQRVGRDDGMSMIEMVIALLIIAIVTTGSLTFFINNLRSVNGQGQRQQAVNLANQQLETVQSVPVDKLVKGRTSAAVSALLATPAAADLRISSQDDTASSANYDPTANGASVPVVPTIATQSVNGVTYSLYTFINACYFEVSTGICGPTVASNRTQEYRVSVDVAWQSNGQCVNNCDYSTGTIIDPTANPQFNSNIGDTSGSYVSVGANNSPGLNPSIAAQSQLSDTCTTGSPATTYNGTKIVLNGTGLKSNIRVWISTGGGVIPAGSIYQPIATEVDFCLQTSEAPGAYTISVINTDGGHFQLPVTEIPSISDASGWDPVNKKLTVTGTGFETGAVFTVSNGASFSSATGQGTTYPASAVGTDDVAKLTNYVGTKDGAATTITVTNPDASTASSAAITAPKITAVSPAIAAGATKTETVTGTGFAAGTTSMVGVSNGSVSGLSVTSSTSATLSATPTSAASPQTFYFYNDDGGFTSNASITVDPQPTVTSASPSPVTAGVSTVVTVNGTGFINGMTATTANGTVVSPVTWVSATQVKVTVNPSTTKTDTVTLLNVDGGTKTFTVNVTPAVTSIAPGSVKAGVATTIAVTGAGFASGMTATTGNGTVVSPVSFVSSTLVNVTVNPSATKTDTVTLTNPDGSQTTFAVAVVPNAISIAPATIGVSAPTTIVVTGAGFAGPMTATTGNGTVGAVTVIDSTHVSVASVNASATKTDTITLTNADGSSTTFTANVIPVVTSFTPNPPAKNSTPTWTITGAGFVSGATITLSGTGFTTVASAVTFSSSTQMTFKAKVVNNNSSTFPFTVTVTNPDGSVSNPTTQNMKPS